MAPWPSVQAQLAPYSLSHFHQPSIPSLEPLLRAGVCVTLVRQLEHELVVLASNTPHWVCTPVGATKISRNWTTPAALLRAMHAVLRKQQGERGEWIQDLCSKPLLFLTRALRGMRASDPQTFRRLAQDRVWCFRKSAIAGA